MIACLYLLGSSSQTASTAKTISVPARSDHALQNVSGSRGMNLDKNM